MRAEAEFVPGLLLLRHKFRKSLNCHRYSGTPYTRKSEENQRLASLRDSVELKGLLLCAAFNELRAHVGTLSCPLRLIPRFREDETRWQGR